jgi:hypothetical protein
MKEPTAPAVGPTNGVGQGFALALNPRSAEDAMKCADWMAKSSLVPKAYAGKPADIVIAAAMGARLGLDPFSALAGISVINGRPALWGDSMLAVCQQRPDWGGMTVEWSGEGDARTCVVTVRRKGVPDYPGRFGVADAKQAGLWGKQGPWQQYPERMMEVRARAFALRGQYADALAGFHAREELDDGMLREAEGTVVADPQPARTGGQATAQQQPSQQAAASGRPKRTAPAAEQQPSEHPAIEHARGLYQRVSSEDATKAANLFARVSRLYGADKPPEIAADRLDDFGQAIADLAKAAGLEDMLATVDQWEAEVAAMDGGDA